MYNRYISSSINSRLRKNKAIVLIGARQVGKTTLIRELLNNQEYLFLDGDDSVVRSTIENANTESIKSIIGNKTLLFIDEAQRINGIGLFCKIIIDQMKGIQLILSGSSSFELNNALNEPLTGRKYEFNLYPISWEEFENKHGYITGEQQLENRLKFGMYPDVLNNPGEEKDILNQLIESYLYQDILSFSGIKKSSSLEKLVQALALQIGSEVSLNELSRLIGIDKNTVNKYIDILEKGFVIFRLPAYSRNLRNEIKNNQKIYFVDNGVRNAIIGNFNPIDLRQDKGALWENFLLSERLKQNSYKNPYAQMYFWRTSQQQEIDLIEQVGEELFAYEFKWSDKKIPKFPLTFTRNYEAQTKFISKSNFREFVML